MEVLVGEEYDYTFVKEFYNKVILRSKATGAWRKTWQGLNSETVFQSKHNYSPRSWEEKPAELQTEVQRYYAICNAVALWELEVCKGRGWPRGSVFNLFGRAVLDEKFEMEFD